MCFEFPHKSPDAQVLFVIRQDAWEQEEANTNTHTHTHKQTPFLSLSPARRDCGRSRSLLGAASCVICELDQSQQLTFRFSAGAASDWKAELFISRLAHTHTLTQSFFRRYAGLQDVSRNVAGPGALVAWFYWRDGRKKETTWIWVEETSNGRHIMHFSSVRRGWSKNMNQYSFLWGRCLHKHYFS